LLLSENSENIPEIVKAMNLW